MDETQGGTAGTTAEATAVPLLDYVAGEIRAWLGRRHMSVAELARRLGHGNQMQLSRRLNGQTPFDVDELRAIARILRVRTSELLPPKVPASAGAGKALDLNQLEVIAARLGIPPADLLPDQVDEHSPWYVRVVQTPDGPNSRPPDNRPPVGPTTHDAIRRPQRRSAVLPAAHAHVNVGRLAR